MSYEIFLEEEKKYLHKQLKPAAHLRFLISPAVITFPLAFTVCQYSIFVTLNEATSRKKISIFNLKVKF